jgi:hypothetical protein
MHLIKIKLERLSMHFLVQHCTIDRAWNALELNGPIHKWESAAASEMSSGLVWRRILLCLFYSDLCIHSPIFFY